MSNDRMLSEYLFAKDVEGAVVTAYYVCPRIYWNHWGNHILQQRLRCLLLQIISCSYCSFVRILFCVGLLHWGMNSTRMTLSASLNADAITFPADLHTSNILVLGEARHLHCWPAYLHWGGNWCTRVSLPVSVDSRNSFPSLHNWQCERAISQCPFSCFPSGILAPSLHTLHGILVLHNHDLLLSQNSSSTCGAFAFAHDVLGWPVWSSWMLIQPLFNPLHHFLICCILVMPSPYASVSWQ